MTCTSGINLVFLDFCIESSNHVTHDNFCAVTGCDTRTPAVSANRSVLAPPQCSLFFVLVSTLALRDSSSCPYPKSHGCCPDLLPPSASPLRHGAGKLAGELASQTCPLPCLTEDKVAFRICFCVGVDSDGFITCKFKPASLYVWLWEVWLV